MLTVLQAENFTGMSASWLAKKRGEGLIRFSKEPGKVGRILMRKDDLKALMASQQPTCKRPLVAWVIKPETYSCKEAAARHKGTEPITFNRLCLRGQYLAKRYGGWSRVPEKEKKTALNAKKVGRIWAIPVAELDRLFLGEPSE